MKVLYFSTVNWKWIKQRPHFIAKYLAEQGHEVDYFSINPLGKTSIRKLKIGNLNVNDSYVLPYSLKSRLIEKINISYIRFKLSKKNYDLIILTGPLQYQYIKDKIHSGSLLVYECMDNMPYFYEGKLRDRMIIEEQKTLDLVDAVITSSDKLQEKIRSRSPHKKLNIKTIFNAVDYKTFQQLPKKVKLQEPNMVYLGTIGSWLDWDILNNFAKNHPHFTIYLVGPNEMKADLHSNIILLGTVPHSEVIDYIYSSNIMLLPFKVNDLTEAVDPVKLYEYLSMNKPIISAYWSELDKLKCDNLLFYENYQEFEKCVMEFHERKISGTLNNSFIERHNWQSRVLEYLDFVNKVYITKKIRKGQL